MADLRWNGITANFNDVNSGVGHAISAYSNVGNIFGQLRKSILDEEQRQIENAFKAKQIQENIRQFDERLGFDKTVHADNEKQRGIDNEHWDKDYQFKVDDAKEKNAISRISANASATSARASLLSAQANAEATRDRNKREQITWQQGQDDRNAEREIRQELANYRKQTKEEADTAINARLKENDNLLGMITNGVSKDSGLTGTDTDASGASMTLNALDSNNIPVYKDPATGKVFYGEKGQKMLQNLEANARQVQSREARLSATAEQNFVNQLRLAKGLTGDAKLTSPDLVLEAAEEQARYKEAQERSRKGYGQLINNSKESIKTMANLNVDDDSAIAFTNLADALGYRTGTDPDDIIPALASVIKTNKPGWLGKKFGDGTQSFDISKLNNLIEVINNNKNLDLEKTASKYPDLKALLPIIRRAKRNRENFARQYN